MGKVIIAMNGNGGIDPDECTAGRAQVLAGYKAGVHGEDEPALGSMPHRNDTPASAALHVDSGKVKMYVPSGYYDGVNDYVWDDQTLVASRGGLTADKMLSGQSALGVTGNIPVRVSSTKAVSCGLNDQGLYYYISPGYWNPDGSGNSWTYMTREEVANTIGLDTWKFRGDQNILGRQGGIPVRGNLDKWLGINETFYLPEGHYSGGTVRQSIPVMGGQTITPSASQQIVSCNGNYMTGDIVITPHNVRYHKTSIYSPFKRFNLTKSSQVIITNLTSKINPNSLYSFFRVRGSYVFDDVGDRVLHLDTGRSDGGAIQEACFVFDDSEPPLVQVTYKRNTDQGLISAKLLGATSGTVSEISLIDIY